MAHSPSSPTVVGSQPTVGLQPIVYERKSVFLIFLMHIMTYRHLAVFLTHTMLRRCGPMHSAAVVAHRVDPITYGAQWCVLSRRPLAGGITSCREAMIAIGACEQPAVHTWAAECIGCAICEDLQANIERRCLLHGTQQLR